MYRVTLCTVFIVFYVTSEIRNSIFAFRKFAVFYLLVSASDERPAILNAIILKRDPNNSGNNVGMNLVNVKQSLHKPGQALRIAEG